MLTLGLVSIHAWVAEAKTGCRVESRPPDGTDGWRRFRGGDGPPLAVSRQGIDVSRSFAYCQKASALADERSTNSRFL